MRLGSLLNTRIRNNCNPAVMFKQVSRKVPTVLRRALGRCGSILYQKRKQLLLSTIYNRKPDREFTNHLRNSEFIKFSGNEVHIGNKASYAGFRGEVMSGMSKTYPGLDLESKFASRAVKETHQLRERTMQDAFIEAHFALKNKR